MDSEQLDIDTFTRIDYAIAILEGKSLLTQRERKDIEMLLRRWRKERYGSALTEHEQREGKSEINP